jgi:hypothetical protein
MTPTALVTAPWVLSQGIGKDDGRPFYDIIMIIDYGVSKVPEWVSIDGVCGPALARPTCLPVA